MNEERDDLWELLGKARRPRVSPFFSRNVLREVRAVQEKPRFLQRLFRHWRLVGISSATTAAIVIGLVQWQQTEVTTEADPLLTEQITDNPDYELIAHLDELLANQENSIWLDDESQL